MNIAKLATQLMITNRVLDAERLLNKEISRQPDNVAAYIARAESFMLRRKYQEAVKDYETVQRLQPSAEVAQSISFANYQYKELLQEA